MEFIDIKHRAFMITDNWDISLLHRINLFLVSWVSSRVTFILKQKYQYVCSNSIILVKPAEEDFIMSLCHCWHGAWGSWAGRGCCWPHDTVSVSGDIRPWSSWQSEVSGELTIILAVVRNNKDIGPASPSMKQILKVLKTRSERQI